MFARFCTSVIVLCFAAAAYAQGNFVINTPINTPTCQPLRFTWSGGKAPYFLSVHPGGQPSSAALISFNNVEGGSFTWTVNIGTGAYFARLRDQDGVAAESGTFEVVAGPSSECIGKEVSTSNGPAGPTNGGGATAPTTAAGAGTGAATTSKPTASTPATGSSNGTKATPSPSTPANETNAAVSKYVNAGALGLAGAAAIAVLL